MLIHAMSDSTPLPTDAEWRISACSEPLWRRWPGEDEYVFYHGGSGDTHRLSESAGLIMEEILAGRGAESTLAGKLQEWGVESPREMLESILDSLERLDFIERARADR